MAGIPSDDFWLILGVDMRAGRIHTVLMTMTITADAARTMDRFSFIALFLIALTRKSANRGPLGYRVNCHRGEYRVVSPIGGVIYATHDADKLYDYARRTQLGTLTREADEFRALAYAE